MHLKSGGGMRFGTPAAIIFLSALFLVSTSTFADDTKSKDKDKDAAAAAESPSDPNAKKSAAITDANASTGAPTSPAPPAPAASDSQATEEHHKWVPMPALDGTPGLFTLGTGDTLPKGGFDVVAGVNKISGMPGDMPMLQVIHSF